MALRAWRLTHDGIDSDQAVAGLMALQALHGHTAAFFWGNQYGGTGEVEVVAALFWVFGASATTLAATSSVLTAVAALLVGAIARRLQPGRPLLAVAAAGAFWVWPEAAVLNSTREFGFRELTMVAGLAAILLVGRLLDTRARRDAAGLGFALGVGWWSSPEIGYFAIAAGVAVLLGLGHPRRRPPVAAWAVGAGTFALGALPWIWANARTGLASLHPASSPTYQASTYAGRLHLFAVDTLPMMLGLREPGDGRWVVGGAGPTLAVVAAVVVVGASAAGLAFARRPGREVHAGCCAATLAFPLAYSTFPATSFWLDGHYAVFLTPLLVLSVVGLVPARPVRLPGRVAVLAGVLGLATATTLVAFDRTELGGDPSALWRRPADPEAARLAVAGALERAGVTVGYADYWVAYDLDFLSGGRLSLADPSADRWVAQYRRVRASPDPAWVFFDPSAVAQASTVFTTPTEGPFAMPEPMFLARLHRLGVGYRIVHAGPLDAVLTDRKVDQAAVGMGAPHYGS